MKTIAKQLNIKEFPFEIKNKNGQIIYSEDSDGSWCKIEYDGDIECYYENEKSIIFDNRVKEMTISEAEKQFKIKIV
jgi:hypothetical protein